MEVKVYTLTIGKESRWVDLHATVTLKDRPTKGDLIVVNGEAYSVANTFIFPDEVRVIASLFGDVPDGILEP